jgi:hypothetical protein
MNQTLGISAGGILPAMSAQTMAANERKASELAQAQPLIKSLAAHVRRVWTTARQAKEQTVEPRMFKAVRARRGEYDPDVLTKIRSQGGSEIYMMLTSNKCRAAASWMRDVMLGSGSDKPWTLKPTPVPGLPPAMMEEMRQQAISQMANVIKVTGQPLPPTQLRKFLNELRAEYMYNLNEEAKFKVSLMERKMEDQLSEGGFMRAIDAFIDDLTTFPAAFIKGPVVRRKPRMKWNNDAASGYQLSVSDELVLEWERVDPFMMYPSPSSTGIEDGDLIERHKLRQTDLEALIGVDGYDDGAIRMVLDEYGRGGLQEWLIVDSTKAQAEGRSTTAVMNNTEHLIDAIQFWGTVSGQVLLDWGLSDKEVPDKAKQYHCEAWLIGGYVIKASLNYHPLGHKPYFKASYEDVPGTFWGNSEYDLIKDCQDMCNSAARALSNNMGISSGPQVYVNVDRIPAGEDITNLYPWKIHQVTSDPMGSSAAPIGFFQPNSNSQELMMVYEKFAVLADEYSGIPRYMTGSSPSGGAGRTASGMSMLMNNANKSMKQVVSNVDVNVLVPLLERLYFYNMRYSEDNELKGDVSVVAGGANSIVAKESAQVRRNEFLAATANPIDMQIMGVEGRAVLLREASKQLDMNPDDIVPPREKFRVAQQLAAMTQAGQPPAPQMTGGPGSGQGAPTMNAQTLTNGAPITDNFSPTAQ